MVSLRAARTVIDTTHRLDLGSEDRGLPVASLGDRVNERMMSSWELIKGTAAWRYNEPSRRQMSREEWRGFRPSVIPPIYIDNSRRSVFGNVGDYNVQVNNAPGAGGTRRNRDEMSDGAAVWLVLGGLAAVCGSIVLIASALRQLMRDEALLREVRDGRQKLEEAENELAGNEAGADNLRYVHKSTLYSYQRMEEMLESQVFKERWFAAASAFLMAAGVGGIAGGFMKNWTIAKAGMAAGCGSAILFTVTCVVGPSEKDREDFRTAQSNLWRRRNGPGYETGGQTWSRVGLADADFRDGAPAPAEDGGHPWGHGHHIVEEAPSPEPSAPSLQPLYPEDELGPEMEYA